MTGNFDQATISEAGGRQVNMDRFGYAEVDGIGCWVVCDGLGSHERSQDAAEIAVATVLAVFKRETGVSARLIERMVETANAAILARRAQSREERSIATTLVVLLCDGRTAMWGHVGDSRLYGLQQGAVVETTRDHRAPANDQLLKALGAEKFVKADISRPHDVQRDDAFLLCVDGFWEKLDPVEMEIDLAKSVSAADWLQFLHRRVHRRQNAESDNYTAIAVRVTNVPAGAPRRQVLSAVQTGAASGLGPYQALRGWGRWIVLIAGLVLVTLLTAAITWWLPGKEQTDEGGSPSNAYVPGAIAAAHAARAGADRKSEEALKQRLEQACTSALKPIRSETTGDALAAQIFEEVKAYCPSDDKDTAKGYFVNRHKKNSSWFPLRVGGDGEGDSPPPRPAGVGPDRGGSPGRRSSHTPPGPPGAPEAHTPPAPTAPTMDLVVRKGPVVGSSAPPGIDGDQIGSVNPEQEHAAKEERQRGVGQSQVASGGGTQSPGNWVDMTPAERAKAVEVNYADFKDRQTCTTNGGRWVPGLINGKCKAPRPPKNKGN